jgi:antitoxin component YwqK of YwqJK toxin-antitoxin module
MVIIEQKTEYYSIGSIKRILSLKNGLLDGCCISFHLNGKPKCIVNYSCGKLNGLYKGYNDKGILTAMEYFNNDKLYFYADIGGITGILHVQKILL